MSLIRIGALAVLLQASFHLAAAEISTQPFGDYDSTWNHLNAQSGLVTSLPSTSSNRLLQKMGGLQAELRSQKERLAHDVDASRFTVGDGVITAVLPGGLLYAAIKQQRHHQAVERLEQVERQLEQWKQEQRDYETMIHRVDALAVVSNASLPIQAN